MIENPWHRLPDEPDYVLPEDKERVLAFNHKAKQKGRQKYELELGLIPEPFVGSPGASVVLLGNNPGCNSATSRGLRQNPVFAARMRDNLLHRLGADFPFLYLDPDSSIPLPCRLWWERKLKALFAD